MHPTEKGVWWKNKERWELYSPADAREIMRAWRNGQTKLVLERCSIDLVSMKQTDKRTGLPTGIKIIPDSEDEDDQAARSSNNQVEKDNNVVTVIPSVTIELQKLSTQCRVEDQCNLVVKGEDQCNLVVKLPKAVAQLDDRLNSGMRAAAPLDVRRNSVMRKTVSLMLEKLSSEDFMMTFFDKRWNVWTGKPFKINPYRLGQPDQSARYGAFLSDLCTLAMEEGGFVDRLFSVAEKGCTVLGDPVEYLFTTVADSASDHILESGVLPVHAMLLRRAPLMKKELKGGERMAVCLGISKFLGELVPDPRKELVATIRAGTVIPLALAMVDPDDFPGVRMEIY